LFSLIAAVAALVTPPADMSMAELQACLGQKEIAGSSAIYEKMKAEMTDAAWTEACRETREANARRLSVARVLRETGTSPVAGYQSVTPLLAMARKATDPDHVQLFNLVAEDQIARSSLSGTKTPIVQGLSPVARRLYDGLVARDAVAADTKSREWLRAAVARRGWFTIDRDGLSADSAAQIIVQHADEDLAFKHDMLVLLEPLVANGQSNRRPFPYMYDRWAAAAGKPLRFGLQGGCKAKGVWEPLTIEDPEHLDERRQKFEISISFAEYKNAMSARCP
jgi:hypothetical protein